MVSDRPVGMMLSGVVDSAGIAASIRRGNHDLYSVVAGEEQSDAAATASDERKGRPVGVRRPRGSGRPVVPRRGHEARRRRAPPPATRTRTGRAGDGTDG